MDQYYKKWSKVLVAPAVVWAIFFVQGKGGSVIDRKDGYQRFG